MSGLSAARYVRCFIAVLLCCGASSSVIAQNELGVESLIYVGTHTGEESDAKGIYLFRMRTSDDPNIPEFVTVTPLGLVAETVNPTFLEIDAQRRLLFCVNEVSNFAGRDTGAVNSFSIDSGSGKLTPLSQRSSEGAGPCHLAMDHQGKFLLVANDRGGTVTVLPVGPDGKLGEFTDIEEHAGSSVHFDRQQGPHPSGVAFSPDNRFVFVCDLGLDKIFIYEFDAEAGKLLPHDPAFMPTKPGAGPRRMVYRPDGKFAYVVNELNSTVTAYTYDPKNGALKEIQTVATLPEHFDGPNTAAEIGVHPSGKNLLVSNCGHHSIVLFTIDARTGTLTYVEDQSTYGLNPRHFGIDADGKHVVVANQESHNILILRAPENARVKPGGNVVKTPSPTCAKFLPKE